jgi:predicted SAM-dependent methyltransferase
MKDQSIKNIYYSTLAKISIFSLYFMRIFRSKSYRDQFINLGSGDKTIPGMLNVDGNIFRFPNIWLDVTLGLPFKSNSIKGIYTSHLLEHLRFKKLRRVLSECNRVLVPSGAVRIVVPSLEYAIRCYIEGAIGKLTDWPEKFNSIGGRFNNFLLCANQHFVIFDFSLLEELLNEAGFRNVIRVDPFESSYFSKNFLLFEKESKQTETSLHIEAYKL